MEQFSFWIQAIISVLSGILVLAPLVVKLIQYVKQSAKEKNWSNLLRLIMSLMEKAETMFETGADKKVWVLQELKAAQETLNYDIDWNVVSNMIDALCEMAKIVNNKAAQ